jgi:succinate dehydrogenase / fumarate reductase membrane anchor subunit
MSVNYGSKRIVVGAHYGLRDWLAQRVTGLLMAIFTFIVLAQVLLNKGPMGYDKWAGIFSAQWMKTLTFASSLPCSTTLGLACAKSSWTTSSLFTCDSLQVFAIVWLVGCAGWAIQVLWRL